MARFHATICVAVIVTAALCHSPQANAQVVQLPSQQIFHVSTTVSVPDRGRMSLGGVNRLREGSVSRGVPGLAQLPGVGRLFKNKGIGRDASSTHASVNAQILSLEELEAEQVGRPSDSFAARSAANRQANFLARNVATHSRPKPRPRKSKSTPSVEEIRKRNELAKQKQELEVQTYIAKGKEAEAAGKIGVAKIYYGMAQRRSSGQMRFYITRHLEKIKKQQAARSLADK